MNGPLSPPLLSLLPDEVGLGDGAASRVEVVTGVEVASAGAGAGAEEEAGTFRNLAEEVVGKGEDEDAGASTGLADGVVYVDGSELDGVTEDSPSSQSLSQPALVRTSMDSCFWEVVSIEQDWQDRILPGEHGSMCQKMWCCAYSDNPTTGIVRGTPDNPAREVEKGDFTWTTVVNEPEEETCPSL